MMRSRPASGWETLQQTKGLSQSDQMFDAPGWETLPPYRLEDDQIGVDSHCILSLRSELQQAYSGLARRPWRVKEMNLQIQDLCHAHGDFIEPGVRF